MKYEVGITRSTENKIRQWGLDEQLLLRLYEEIDSRLSVIPPDELPYTARAPVRFKNLKIDFDHPATGVPHSFFLWVNDTMKDGVHTVIDIQYLV